MTGQSMSATIGTCASKRRSQPRSPRTACPSTGSLFTERRLAKFNGVPATTFELHLNEYKWRRGKSVDTLRQELNSFQVLSTLCFGQSSQKKISLMGNETSHFWLFFNKPGTFRALDRPVEAVLPCPEYYFVVKRRYAGPESL